MNNWGKDIAQWRVGATLYLSVPFTWLVKKAEKIADAFSGNAIIGGPGLMKPTECAGFEPILFHNPSATFTSRGCPNRCSFCAVHILEPEFYEIPNYRPAPVICDNNFSACTRKHQEMVVYKQRVFYLTDFNQGLEAKRFTPELADLLGTIRVKVRFAFDDWNEESAVHDAIELCRERTTNNIGVYCLIGFNDTPDDAKARLELIRSWGVRPTPMRYQPLDADNKNDYILPDSGWTEIEMRRIMHYYSRLRWLEHIPYSEFLWLEDDAISEPLFTI